jgi:Terminase RNaseH-like domain
MFTSQKKFALSDQFDYLIGVGGRLDEEFERGLTWRDHLVQQLRVRDKNGCIAPLTLNRVQKQYSADCGRRNIVLKARQLGMTTYIAARFFVETITRPGTLSVQVAHDQDSAEEIFRIVHRFLENLPEWLRKGALTTSRANVRQVVFPYLDSEYRVETAADPNAGRGLTIQNLHCSEVARWPRDAGETLASLRAAVPPDAEIVLESTPNGAAGAFYEEWQRADTSGYVRHFFPWWWDAKYVREDVELGRFDAEEKALIENHGLTSSQIAFRREIRANFRRLARQEYAEDAASCFLASGECVFDVDALDRRLASAPAPHYTRDSARLLVWLPPVKGAQYVIGVDPAGGGADGDYSCAQIIDRDRGLQCAEYRGHLPPQELAARVAELGREYNNALISVERNNHGHAVLAHLTTTHAYENLYQQGGQPGWLTSVVTRPAMIENFAAVLAAAPELVSSERLLKECRSFVRATDGSAAAASGAHDDTVMAMAIALAVRKGM